MEDRIKARLIDDFLRISNRIMHVGAFPGTGFGAGKGCGMGYMDGRGFSNDNADDWDGYDDGKGGGDDFLSLYGHYRDTDGRGNVYGRGEGCGTLFPLTEYNGQKVYMIDGVATLIDSVHQIYAKGKIIRDDMIVVPCYIARVGNSFAHGATLRKAMADARAKDMESKPLKIRIAEFRKTYPDADKKIPASELYGWHHILTGSCEMGRKQFAHAHGIDIDGDSMTVREFVSLTSHAYGSDAIRKLAETYGIDTKGL